MEKENRTVCLIFTTILYIWHNNDVGTHKKLIRNVFCGKRRSYVIRKVFLSSTRTWFMFGFFVLIIFCLQYFIDLLCANRRGSIVLSVDNFSVKIYANIRRVINRMSRVFIIIRKVWKNFFYTHTKLQILHKSDWK